MDAPASSSRPTSARGAPLTLAERVALYCHQSTAANNAGVLRSVAKPTADEIAEFLEQSCTEGSVVYDDPALVRLLLTDSDYDAVCRETLNLQDAITWHAKHAHSHRKQASTPSLHLLLLSAHVFTDDELRAALELAAMRGMDDVLALFPADGNSSVTIKDRGAEMGGGSKASDQRRLSPRSLAVKTIEDDGSETSKVPDDDHVLGDRGAVSAEVDAKGRTQSLEHVSYAITGVSAEVAQDSVQKNASSLHASDDHASSLLEMPKTHDQVADAVKNSTGHVDAEGNRDEAGVSKGYVEPMATYAWVEATIHAAVDRSVQHIVSTPRITLELDTEAESTLDFGERSGDEAVPVQPDEGLIKHAVVATDAPAPESASGIESIVRTLDADLLHGEGADLDDIAFGEDAQLLGELTSAMSLELEAKYPGPLLAPATNDLVQPAIDPSEALTIVSNGNEALAFKVGAMIEARYKGTVHYFPGTIVAAHVSDGTFDVSYKDGDAETHVRSNLIRHPTAASPRSLLLARSTTTSSNDQTSSSSSFSRIPHDTSAPELLLRVGDTVEARYRGLTKFFPGEIAAVLEKGQYDVRYADGEYEGDVRAEWIRPIVGAAVVNGEQDPGVGDATAATAEPLELGGRDAKAETRELQHPAGGDAATAETTERQAPATHTLETEVSEPQGVHVVRTVTTTESERHAVSELIDVQSHVEEEKHRTPVQEAPLVQGSTAPSPHGPPEARDSESTKPSQRVMKSKSTRDTRSSPRPLAMSLPEGTRIIRPGPRAEIPLAGDNSEDGRLDSPAPVTRSHLQRESSKRSESEVEQPVLQPPSSRSRSGTDKSELRASTTPRDSQTHPIGRQGAKPVVVETTHVVPFKDKRKQQLGEEASEEDSPTIASARALLADHVDSDDDELPLAEPIDLSDDDDDDALAVDRILNTSARIQSTVPIAEPVEASRSHTDARSTVSYETKRTASSKKKKKPRHHEPFEPPEPAVPMLSASTLRYLTPQPAKHAPMTARTQRPKTTSSHQTTTPRAAMASQRARQSSSKETASISWKELEEWKNVDAILHRKRRVMHNGHVEGSDVPWGEEFASIQSLKRFAVQYPDVLRDHIESQLAEVVHSDHTAGRPVSTKATSAARDALFLIKDLAFLLRHRLAPFFDSILPVVLPAVFHSQKRFLCDTVYQVLEALVTHCSSRRLVVALLKQALRFPRADLRLVNLTCLYVEKCLAALSVAAVEELVARCASSVLDAVAELLTCKSAACQSSLQKSLLVLQYAVGEDAMDHVLADHLVDNALALVRRHVALAETAARGVNKSPSTSPKKLSQQQSQHNATPAKQVAALAAAASASGGVSILQRMLAQRQNRVVPASE